jgi:hypothetical protein
MDHGDGAGIVYYCFTNREYGNFGLLPNGLELSGPAKIRSDYRAELAGSAPASG